MNGRRIIVLLLASVALVAAGCGGDDSEATGDTDTVVVEETTTEDTSGATTTKRPARRRRRHLADRQVRGVRRSRGEDLSGDGRRQRGPREPRSCSTSSRQVPDEIEDDFQVIADNFAKIAEAIKESTSPPARNRARRISQSSRS